MIYEHGSIEDEKLAERWHAFGEAASWAMAGVCFLCGALALAGAYWHRWGAEAHRDKIKEMSNG